MVDTAKIPIEIQLVLSRYTRDAKSIVRDAKAIDKALDDAKRSTKQLAAALDALKSGKIAIDVDLSGLSKAESAVKAIDGLSPDVTVDISVDEQQVQSDLNSIVAPDLKVNVSANEEDVQSQLNSLTSPDLKVDVTANTTDAESDIKDSLDQLKGLAKIQIALEILPMAGDIVGAVGGLATPILEADRALKQLQGTTNEYIPDADRLISDIFINGWGESRQEVAESIAQFVRLRGTSDDLERSITSTFAAAQVTGFSFNEVLKASDKLVANGLVPTISDANDLIVDTFQQGGDRAEDLLDTLTEYSPHFAQLGIDGGTAMNLINQGLRMGTRDGDKLADTFKELGIRLEESVATEAGPYYDALVRTGLFDEAQAVVAGELSGAAFAQAAVDAANAGVATDFDLAEIFGTPLEDFGYDIFKNLDFSGAMEAIIPEDAAINAAAVINDNLNQTLTETGRILQDEVLERFGGLDGILDTINEKAQEFNTLLKGGADIPEALEIILETPGLADNIRTLESIFGNLVLEIEIAVANLLEGLGTDVTGIRGDIAQRAETQLAFDLQTADTEQELAGAVERAMQRGVSLGAASDAANTAIQEMIAKGNIEGARALSGELSKQQVTVELSVNSGILNQDQKVPLSFTADMNMTPEDIEAQAVKLAQQYATATGNAVHGIGIDVTQLDLTVSDTALQGAVDVLNAQVNEKLASGQTLSAIQQLAGAGFVEDAASIASTSLTTLTDNFMALLQPAQEVVAPLNDIDATNLAATALAARDMATAFQVAQDAGWPITEEELALIGQAGTDFFTLQGKLTEYTLGLQDAETQGVAALENLRTAGIDPTIVFTDNLTESTSAYVLGLQGQLAVAKLTWQDYLNYLTANNIPLDAAFTAPPTVPTEGQGFASGGRAAGWAMVGERGPELAYFGQGADILNNQTSSALMSLMNQLGVGGGGSTVNNYINVNVLQNNNSIAAGNASAGALSAQLRGFAG